LQNINVLISELQNKLHTKRIQVRQQHDVIRELQEAAVSTNSAEMLLDRMLDRIDKLCAELERLKRNWPIKTNPLPGSRVQRKRERRRHPA
jgi:hypothetical protein